MPGEGSNMTRPMVNTTVTMQKSINTYTYNSKNLFLSYGLAIFFALLANLLGAFAYWRNGASFNKSISSFWPVQKDEELGEFLNDEVLVHLKPLPLEKTTKKTVLKFGSLRDGHWGLRRASVVKVGRNRRKSLRPRRPSQFGEFRFHSGSRETPEQKSV